LFTLKSAKTALFTLVLTLAFVLSTITLPLLANAQSTSVQTVVISNAITILVNAGYGNLNPYQALDQIVQDSNPSYASIVTPSFLKALHDCPASSTIFTTHLKDYSSFDAIGISTDGTVWTTSYTGTDYYNARGTASLDSQVSGVGNFRAVYNSSQPLITLTSTSSGTTYNIFAFLYVPSAVISTGNPTSATTPTPTAPEFPSWTILSVLVLMLICGSLMVYVKKTQEQKNCFSKRVC
jgi:hypothetical protein